MKPPLLFLVHRIPYPPNKGDKIRSFHVLKHLSQRYRIYLGTFVDDTADLQHVQKLGQWCEETCVRKLDPRMAKLRSLSGFLTGQPLTLPYYRDAFLREWVVRTMEREGISRIFIYSSAMAQYVLSDKYRPARRIMDLVDVDSDKWRQYAGRMRWPMSWVYRREADCLLGFEKEAASRFDGVCLVSEPEAELFRKLAPEVAGRVFSMQNGVDLGAFDPEEEHADPYAGAGPHLVFTGAMDYWPNIDAVVWFVEEVLPALRRRFPGLLFHIVGSRPAERVRNLSAEAGVEVTGSVADIRPYMAHADVVVAPMRIARGIQNKVLEAMSMGKPVVVTSLGLEGIAAVDGEEVLVADDAGAFSEAVSGLLEKRIPSAELGKAARRMVARDFAWESTLPVLDRWLEDEAAAAAG